MIKASIIGATGYAGAELIRLLCNHPHVEIVHMVSSNFEGKQLNNIYPNFCGINTQILENMDIDQIAKDSDIVFTALPHGISGKVVKDIYSSGTRIIDLSGDFRYRDKTVYEKWYGIKHPCPELLEQAVYGLPEIHKKDIKNAPIIGNPGCYTTCSILGLAPLLFENIIDPPSIIIDAKSGASGAGRSSSNHMHFCEMDENIMAYNIGNHRHTSEIEMELSLIAKTDIKLSFTPHILPLKRGILCTMYANLIKDISSEQISSAYDSFYHKQPFIIIHKGTNLPEIKFVTGSNMCHIGFVIDKRLGRIVVLSAIDNLIKGAGGQAIQNMNIIFDMDETTGLLTPGWYL
ncbi:N-acetyl-gamma-glutamyl-phosphate reductase [Xylanivirga thermophila]|uniref:N-acetyl-gamma-glutamyl-phosphate reductase n=1 Tax=Xylanivirga thermophila TaxID=2496273 RepID=UPI00101D829A|nr:N-acetyl-gamma-glutamyl-phosphate reductase [Xylanivirga thermophila]